MHWNIVNEAYHWNTELFTKCCKAKEHTPVFSCSADSKPIVMETVTCWDSSVRTLCLYY